jgi:quinohemoprotein ethanol dehydrogenase
MNRWVLVAIAVILIAILLLVPERTDDADSAPADPTSAAETSAVTSPSIAQIDDARIIAAEDEPDAWLAYGRDYYEQRFSPLTDINRDTVDGLGLAWSKDMNTNFALESTPIMVDGTLFFSSTFSSVHAVDAATGAEKWSYDPEVPRDYLRRACCGPVNRGVAVYNGRVYVGTLDGRLIAIDAADGSKVWEVDTIIDRTRNYTITGAPRAARGKIYIGNGGAEFGVRGYVTAYDANSGEQAWRFFTVPGNPALPFEHPEMELAAETWKGGQWWEIGGGGTVWNSIVYDPDFNHVYLGVGNGAPWTRVIRSPGGGDNLFLASIVAVDADTGEMKWYYQTTPGDNWDYTAVQDMMLADMVVDGEERKVLMQAPKNGFFYVIDRSNGELLRANPFVTTTWATHVDMETGRPVENPEMDYNDEPKWILPGPLGGHNWQAMSFDADSGVVYFPAQENPLLYAMNEEYKATGLFKRNPGTMNLGLELANIAQLMTEHADKAPAAKGYLKAFNPLTGEDVWTVEHEHYWNGGVMASAGGLVFQGDAMGDFKAYDAGNGDVLWSFNTYASILAPPMSFSVGGEQYVVILTGTGGGDHFSGHVADTAAIKYGNFGKVLAFKLGAGEVLATPTVLDRTIPPQPELTAAADDVTRGNQLYHQVCALCHGALARSAGAMPDLRFMTTEKHEAFEAIVLNGILAGTGMASFADILTSEDAERIRQYVISQALADQAAAL